jgi:acetyltransferase-like isoleucine patch superfamily enzyme
MIKIGCHPAKAKSNTKLIGRGTYIFHGDAEIWGGCIIENNATIEFGDKFLMAESVQVMCAERIVFEDHVRIGFDSTLMDTDFHFILDIDKKRTSKNFAPIVIESGSWISSDCKIMKGAHLPKNSVVSGGSLINKNYENEAPNQIYVGVPAKPIRQNIIRIHNVREEDRLTEYFKNNPNEKYIDLNITDDLEDYCFSNYYR